MSLVYALHAGGPGVGAAPASLRAPPTVAPNPKCSKVALKETLKYVNFWIISIAGSRNLILSSYLGFYNFLSSENYSETEKKRTMPL